MPNEPILRCPEAQMMRVWTQNIPSRARQLRPGVRSDAESRYNREHPPSCVLPRSGRMPIARIPRESLVRQSVSLYHRTLYSPKSRSLPCGVQPQAVLQTCSLARLKHTTTVNLRVTHHEISSGYSRIVTNTARRGRGIDADRLTSLGRPRGDPDCCGRFDCATDGYLHAIRRRRCHAR